MQAFYRWSEEELDELDAKFDALAEHLGIEFVFEKVSDGSDAADRTRWYVRKKAPEVADTTGSLAVSALVPEPRGIPEPIPEYEGEAAVTPGCAKCTDLGRKCIRHRKKGY